MIRGPRTCLSVKLTRCLTLLLVATWLPALAATALLISAGTGGIRYVAIAVLVVGAAGSSAAAVMIWKRALFPLSHRIGTVLKGADQLARGMMHKPLNDQGNDDLAELCHALDRIARQNLEESFQRERVSKNLSHQATHDELTGLSNRKFGNETIARLSNENTDLPTSILFLDLDGFKAVNDTCGHAVGDEILVAFSLRLKAILSDDTVIIRWGGDEFVIVLTGADERAAISVAQDVADLFKQPIATTQGVHKLGCSIGLSTSRPDKSLEAVLEEADASMYDQKKLRKSRSAEQAEEQSAKPPALSFDEGDPEDDVDDDTDWLEKAA